MKRTLIAAVILAGLFSCKKKEEEKPKYEVTYYVYSKSGKAVLNYKDGDSFKDHVLTSNTATITAHVNELSAHTIDVKNTARQAAKDSLYLSVSANGKEKHSAFAFVNSDAKIKVMLSDLK